MNSALVRRDPLNLLFSNIEKDMTNMFSWGTSEWFKNQPTNWVPNIDVSEQEEKIILRMDIPGVKDEDIEINYYNETLTISGTKHQYQSETNENHYLTERSIGEFKRTIHIPPATINVDSISAIIENGVLMVDIPKKPEVKPRKIEIQKLIEGQ